MNEKIKSIVAILSPFKFRILFTCLFLIFATLILLIGFWKTFIIALFACLGFTIGKMRDENLDIYSLIESIRSMLNN
ncbi:DUF2273 domain-containing protein [Enterococcus sp. LJL99]